LIRSDSRQPTATQAIGLLSQGPHPVLFELLYEPHFVDDRKEVLPWLLEIDAAHTVMLARTGILAASSAAELLTVNRELVSALAAGEPVLGQPPSHRGLYLVYERHYIDRLGSLVGGAAHVARSRNDINAAVVRLRLRSCLLDLLDHALELLAAALALGELHAGSLMSGFTHLQPAQPATLGHYLAGICAELLRSAERLGADFDEVNRSPMGAAAGLGTSFPIDRELTASLLGFAEIVDNSVDAVASRDYAVNVLSALSVLGIALTRLALDLQTWGSHAYGFLAWPDELVSTSSIMPQKRNAFVLENIRGLAGHPVGALTAMLLALKNTPFSNGVEVGTEAVSHLWPALGGTETALRLTTLMLRGVEVNVERMYEFLAGAGTTMTALADHLVARHGLAFRTAHDAIGQLVLRLPRETRESPGAILSALGEILGELTGREIRLDEAELARALDPTHCVQAAVYGGGPAPETVRGQLQRLAQRRERLAERVAARRQQLSEARAGLQTEIESILDAGPWPRERRKIE
jgi:argininosuccinate lyase